MKRAVSGILALMMVLFVLAGCSGGNSSSDNPESTPAAGTDTNKSDAENKVEKQVTLEFFHWRNEDKEAYETLIEKFERENPGIKIDMQITVPANYTQALKTRLASGQKVADVLFVRAGDEFLSVSQAGGFIDLANEPYVSQYKEDHLSLGQYEGKQYALLHTINVLAPVYYNKRIFKELNLEVPKTWEEFLEVCEAIKKAGYMVIADGGGDRWPIAMSADPLLYAAVQHYKNIDIKQFADELVAGKIPANDQVFIDVAEVYKELTDRGYHPKSNLSSKFDETISMFAQEQAAMVMAGSWSMATVRSHNPNIDFGFLNIPMPKYPTHSALVVGAFVGIDAKSPHQEEAKKFVAFLSDPVNAAIVADMTGQVVPVKDVKISNPDVLQVQDMLKDAHKYFRSYLPNLAYSEAMIDMLSRVISGQSIDTATSEMQKQFDIILQK